MNPLFPLTAATLVLLLGACADTSPGGKAVSARHERFEEMGAAMKAIGGELEKDNATSATVRQSADRLAALAPQVKGWFPAGSGPQDGKRTDAKAEIWTRQAEFGAAATRFEAAAVALKAAADAGDAAKIRAAVQTVGAACKACHQTFKED
ncbi:c-type cytochrome [Novosphingobium piscinae]|uniref:Cytochrome c n=1 Tax=Novosphingobium piscinae TaxID=1507448 RepID=A0A7X1G0Q6_9SPHN|nr:cytochrome c [Novosphingobium piscinae]MBC2670519.1 cytochrome c [Novosphingobium piscinae]